MFCCSGERPRKGGVRFAKGLNTIIFINLEVNENLIILSCPDSAGARKGAKGSRKVRESTA